MAVRDVFSALGLPHPEVNGTARSDATLASIDARIELVRRERTPEAVAEVRYLEEARARMVAKGAQ